MKKKVVKKANKRSFSKKATSTKSVWHKALPVRWSFLSISIMTVLAAVAIILPQTGVLGASTGPVQVSINAVMKDGSSIKLTSPQGFVFKVVQTTEVKHKKVTKTLMTHTITSLPNTYPFTAATSSAYTISLTALPGTAYTVLNGYRVINVKNGKTECKTSTTKNNPCTFFVMKSVKKQTGDLGQKEGTATASLKARITTTPHSKSTTTSGHQ